MEFRLVYEGPLPHQSRDIRAVKHGIREQLHPQLYDLCRRSGTIARVSQQIVGQEKSHTTGLLKEPDLAVIGAKYNIGGIQFVPILVGALHLVCSLDILFLRRESSWSLISKPKDEYGGDLDNRLKIFLDALRTPRDVNELPSGAAWPDTEPFFCLLEDDSLITKFQVEADTLLGQVEPDKQKDVRLVVHVTTKVTRTAVYNIDYFS